LNTVEELTTKYKDNIEDYEESNAFISVNWKTMPAKTELLDWIDLGLEFAFDLCIDPVYGMYSMTIYKSRNF
jgi:hypothetical protein